jgi:pimeloyl-ACP methyl ester carboxylesterase
VERKFIFKDAQDRRVSAVLSSPHPACKRIMVLCHGFMGYKDSWINRTLSETLARHGVATLRFDFFGHGESEGQLQDILLTTLVSQTESAIAMTRGHGFTHIGLLGSSFGGLVALLVAAKSRALSVLGLRCPVSDFPALLQQQFGRMAIELWRRLGQVPDSLGHIPVHYRFYEDCRQYNAYRAAEAVIVPTMIVHGQNDEVIPVNQSRKLIGHIRGTKTLHVIDGADHRFSSPGHFSRMTELLADWCVRYLSVPTAAV